MNTNNIKIREATSQDSEHLAELGAGIFKEAYQHPSSQDDMDAYLRKNFNKDKNLRDMRDPDITFLIAEGDEGIFGYAKLIARQRNFRFETRNNLEIRHLYVDDHMTGKKIGQALLEASMALAQNQGRELLWLSVWENNDKAIAFYKRYGFKTVGKGEFSLGETKRNYLVMKKNLR